MDIDLYQRNARQTAIYPGHDEPGNVMALAYTVLGLSGEAGEIANKVKKIIRDQGSFITEENVADLRKEIGDVLWYVAQMCSQLGISLNDIAIENCQKLQSRKSRGVLGGSGDNR